MLEEYFGYKPDEETSEFLDGLSFHEIYLRFFLIDSDSVNMVLHFLGTLEEAEKLKDRMINDLVNVGEFSYVFNPYAAKKFSVRKTVFKPRGVSVVLEQHVHYGLDLIPLKDETGSIHLLLPFNNGFRKTYFSRGFFLYTANEEHSFLFSGDTSYTQKFRLLTADVLREAFQEYLPKKPLVHRLNTPLVIPEIPHRTIYSVTIPQGVLYAVSSYRDIDELIGVSILIN